MKTKKRMSTKSRISFFLIAMLLVIVTSKAQVVKSGNKCFKMELVGSMIDVKKCKDTQIYVKSVDCKTFKPTGVTQKVMAQMSQCKNQSAQGMVVIDKEKVYFQARLRDNPQFEAWDIKSSSTVSMADALNPKNLSSLNKTKEENLDEDDDDSDKSSFQLSGVDVEAEWVLGLSPNKRGIVDSTSPVGGYYGRTTNAVSDLQIYQNQVAFNYLTATITPTVNEKIFAEFSLFAGQKVPYWLSSPYGITKTNTLELGNANLEYEINQQQSLTVGVWSRESMNQYDSVFASHSSFETLVHPHIYSGFIWNYRDDNQVGGLYVVNGWNELVDINNSFSVGVTHSKRWTQKWKTDFLFYTGTEGSTGVGTLDQTLKHFEIMLDMSEIVNFGIIYGKWGADYSYNDLLVEFLYHKSKEETLGFRIEDFTNDQAWLLKNGWIKFINLSLAYRRDVLKNSAFKMEVNYSNALETIDNFPTDKEKNRLNLYSSVIIKF